MLLCWLIYMFPTLVCYHFFHIANLNFKAKNLELILWIRICHQFVTKWKNNCSNMAYYSESDTIFIVNNSMNKANIDIFWEV